MPTEILMPALSPTMTEARFLIVDAWLEEGAHDDALTAAAGLDAVIFDGPILAHYAQNEGARYGEVLDSVFRPESYGIALPTGTPLREDINVALLRLIETGVYSDLSVKWFGGPR